MKFNWGTGLAIFYSTFVIIMISMVVFSTYHKADLVQKDYYQLDLDYEQHRIKRANNAALDVPIEITLTKDKDGLHINFPSSMTNINGTVHLFRPSNKNDDQHYPIQVDADKNMKLDFQENLSSGLWSIKMDWEANGKGYYKESSLVI